MTSKYGMITPKLGADNQDGTPPVQAASVKAPAPTGGSPKSTQVPTPTM